MTSVSRASSAGVAGAAHPSSVARSRAFGRVRFQTAAEQAGLVKIAGHVRAHRAQTQEPDAHRVQLLAPPAQASSIA